MALSERAIQVKNELMRAVVLKRALAAAVREWEDVLAIEECLPVAEEWAQEIHGERYALQKELAQAQLDNWTHIRRVPLKDTQWRVLRLRYVLCLPWSEIVNRVGCSKQYLLRVHNAALERIAVDRKVPQTDGAKTAKPL